MGKFTPVPCTINLLIIFVELLFRKLPSWNVVVESLSTSIYYVDQRVS